MGRSAVFVLRTFQTQLGIPKGRKSSWEFETHSRFKLQHNILGARQRGKLWPLGCSAIVASQIVRLATMYLEHFGLERNPFSLTPDPRFLFLTSKYREAVAMLIFGVLQRKGFLVMTGEAGTGK